MRVFKTKWLARFARRERIPESSLLEAIAQAERGLIDADLGGGLIKQRVAWPGEGRSGGYRVVIVYRIKTHAFFIYGFAKNDRDNVEDNELQTMRDVAASLLDYDESRLHDAILTNELEEIDYGKETPQ